MGRPIRVYAGEPMFTALIIPLLSLAAVDPPASAGTIRIVTYNVFELTSEKLDRVDTAGHGTDAQAQKAAQIIQLAKPDILFLNEIDYAKGHGAELFLKRYLQVSQSGQTPLAFQYMFTAPVNTGEPTGLDLDHDGRTDGPADAYGFGRYPGQYGMALFSRFPIDSDHIRTFRKFLWKDMPGNLIPDGQAGKPAWYTPQQTAILRLSSKSHWDIPVRIHGRTLHILASHPTPPVFDGAEDRNGRRNFDEIRLWKDYLTGGSQAEYLVDDAGHRGGLPPDALFVVVGDLNADPVSDESNYGQTPIAQLLRHRRIQDPAPSSQGAAACPQAYRGDKSRRTAEFGRADYILPAKELLVRGCGVFWPAPGEPLEPLVAGDPPASDHHLVWIDLSLPETQSHPAGSPASRRCLPNE